MLALKIHSGLEHSATRLQLVWIQKCRSIVVVARPTMLLLDATGRMLKAGKRGAIPPELAPILARLDLSVDAWLATMLGWRMFAFTSALGHAATRATEATKRGLAWIRNRCPLFAA